MAIKTKKASEWLSAYGSGILFTAANGAAIANASKASLFTAANGAAIAKASQAQMLEYMNSNLRPLQDGVYIGKQQREDWGNYFRIEPWQTTQIGIAKADADAIVIQYGGYRLGISLDEPAALSWGSKNTAESIGYRQSSDLNTFDGLARTNAIMKSTFYKDDDPATYAVAYAHAYHKGHTGDPGGDTEIAAGSWYLPTMGDLALIHQHFETINLALQRIKNAGKQSVSLLQRMYYWSCMELSGQNAWGLNFSNGIRGGNGKLTNKYHVRPVTAF